MPKECVYFERSGFNRSTCLAGLPYPDDLRLGDGGSEAHAPEYVGARLRARRGPGGHGDVGDIFLMLLVTHCQRKSSKKKYVV